MLVKNNHRVIGHDPTILDCLPDQREIPFILLHRTEFTQDFFQTCTGLIRGGMNFHSIETYILEQRWESFAMNHDLKKVHGITASTKADDMASFLSSDFANCPSNDILSKCFLVSFLQDESLFMTSIEVGETISFDHTFKVASNIGYNREDGTWVSQYDGLFIVLNKDGKIVTWQLTKETSFAETEDALAELCTRCDS